MSSLADQPHAVCVPWPGQGHINAMLNLAKVLHSKGFHITFVHSLSNYNRVLKSGGDAALQGLVDFRFASLPDNEIDSRTAVLEAIEKKIFSAPLGSLIMQLNDASSGVPPVSCIVSDSFTTYTLDVAREFQIPDVFFCPVSACSYMGFIDCKQLIERGVTPLKGESDLTNGYLDTPIEGIPGLKNMRLRDLPSIIRTTDPNDVFLNSLSNEAHRAFQATAIIMNTFDDLEQEVLNAMSAMLPPIYTVGPLTLLCGQLPATPATPLSSNLLKEDDYCIKWLEQREIRSVLYVNFGSLVVLSRQQLMEFAWGLADAEHYFLWVIRPDLVGGEDAALPSEFLTAIEGKGLLASWCPQERVLAHASVGGFLTHSGWNSTMESVSAGVPMICWPWFGDQMTNCRYVCNEWGIGMEMDSDVKREQVQTLVKELMEGEKGKEMRKKAVEWKEKAESATKPGGSSSLNVARLLEEVLFLR